MSPFKIFAQVAFVFACLLIIGIPANAQYRTSIQGVVTDSSGAVVPDANLTLINPATGEKQVRVSNEAGVYNFNALPAAQFRLEVEKKGFQKKVIDNIQLNPEQANALDIQLVLGTETETVTVDGSTVPAMDTETASIAGTISKNQI
jgi:hypothetical protein